MSSQYKLDRRLVAQVIALCVMAPAAQLWSQPPIINVDTDCSADNEALYVAKNVLCFARGQKSIKTVQVVEIQHNDAGSNRASVVRLSYLHKKARVNAVVTMEMIKKPGLRRIYQLTYRDDLNPLYFPEQLLQVREQVNTALARGDLLTRLTPHRVPFEMLPLVDEIY